MQLGDPTQAIPTASDKRFEFFRRYLNAQPTDNERQQQVLHTMINI
jgi:hypothetical protein